MISLPIFFVMQHPGDMVQIPKAEYPGKCKPCGLQVTYEHPNQGHEDSQLCRDLEARKLQHRAAGASIEALQQELTAYGEEFARVEIFKYLRRLIPSMTTMFRPCGAT